MKSDYTIWTDLELLKEGCPMCSEGLFLYEPTRPSLLPPIQKDIAILDIGFDTEYIERDRRTGFVEGTFYVHY